MSDTHCIERLETSAYCIPTDAPEADGTLAWDSEEARRDLLELIPYGRVGEVEDVAQAPDIGVERFHGVLAVEGRRGDRGAVLRVRRGVARPTAPDAPRRRRCRPRRRRGRS